jgi:Zn-dependent protease/CBS domain-containing protein
MRRGSVQLVRIAGIRVGATPSWFFVLFLLIYLLSGTFDNILRTTSSDAFWCAVAATLLFEASLVLHELGHALVARRFGIATTGIDLWFFGGLAKLERDPETPGKEFAVAAAGPSVTALIIAACFIAGAASSGVHKMLDATVLSEAHASAGIALLGFVAGINLLLLVFNLIPAYPLDGGRIARAVAWRWTGDRNRGTRFSGRLGEGFSYVLIGGGAFVALRGDTFDGVWFMILGWFMSQSARAAIVGSRVQERIEGVTAEQLMDSEPLTMPSSITALQAAEDWFANQDWPFFPVVDESGRYLGVLTAERVEGAITAGQPALTVRELLDDQGADDFHVAPEAVLQELLSSAALRTLGAVMVVDAAGALRGVVTVEQVRRALAAAVPTR